ncbi:unnamed protein product [Effrenium voratum]|uniref:Pentatricopeptide repeat-containing protein, chloroplastic n=1 Tax=Effrenium voratum TaxID=2562239 RepID=A0AA36IWJ8_9DINO|nr:unnamed protein product [Effrenium voratum]
MDVERRFDRAVEDRNLRQVLAEMRGADSAEVQKAGCDAGGWDRVGGTGGTVPFRVVQHNPGAAKEAMNLHAVKDALCEAILRFPGDGEVCTEASTAIWRLVREGGFTVAKATIDEGAFDALRLVMEGFPEGSAPNEAALLALGALADHGLVSFEQPQLQELQQVKHKGKAFAKILIVPVTYNATMSAASADHWELSIELFREMQRHLRPSVVSFGCAMRALRPQWPSCLLLLEELLQKEKPNLISFNTALSAVARAGAWQIALRLLQRIEMALMDPNVISFTSTMESCTAGGAWEKSLQVFQAMLKERHRPDLVSMNVAMAAAQAGGHWALILQLLADMPARKLAPNEVSFSTAIASCLGQWRAACLLLASASRRGQVPDIGMPNMVLAALADGEEWQRALDLFTSLPARSITPDVFSLSSLTRCHRWQAPGGLAAWMRRSTAPCCEP